MYFWFFNFSHYHFQIDMEYFTNNLIVRYKYNVLSLVFFQIDEKLLQTIVRGNFGEDVITSRTRSLILFISVIFTLPYHPVLVFRVLPLSLRPRLETLGCL